MELNFNGLSLDQKPPIWAPLRFFLTAPLFGVLAGILMLFSDTSILINRYSLDAIVTTHVITIGVFSFIMFGSLVQMLPLLSRTKITNVKLVTLISYFLLVFGLLAMTAVLKFDVKSLAHLSYISLGSGFFIMILSIAYSLRNIRDFNATIRGIITSLVFSIFIVIFGLLLLFEYANESFSEYHNLLANIHSVWAVFGFCGVLIIGIAFQVLPMFYIAPKFKQFCKKRVVYLITTGLILWLIANIYFVEYALYAKLWVAVFFWAFATTVWLKFNRRKKPKADVTVWYWRGASIFLTLGSFLWIFDEFFKHEYIVMVAILIGGGFILSIMLGMLYKIVPFLIWFHLDEKGYTDIPNIDDMMDKDLAKIQFVLLILSIIGFIFAFYMPKLLAPSASFFIISMLILEYVLLTPVLLYRRTIKKNG